MSETRLRFSTNMLRRLGEELNPQFDQGILELVRNAYDADATTCTVELIDTARPRGAIIITDDGEGMSRRDIEDGWLVVGSSSKSCGRSRRGRLLIGNKGIGRLAALRMGMLATLISRPRDEPTAEHHLCIDWSAYAGARVVEDVPLQIQTMKRPKGIGMGTVVQIESLRKALEQTEVRRLARAMVLLADPFEGTPLANKPFHPILKAEEFEELAQLVRRGFLAEADYKLRAELDERGKAQATLCDSLGRELFRASHKELCTDHDRPVYKAPAAILELWTFLLGGKAKFSPREVTLSQAKTWLTEFGGVHLFHRGMRVSPYSDFDWLGMNLRRVRAGGEQRASTNNSVGRILVTDEEGQLVPKTDRVGFIEDEAFQELRRFATDALDWMTRCRLKRSEKVRESKKRQMAHAAKQARRALDDALESVPAADRDRVQKAVEDYERAKQGETNTLREDLQLYRTLCTVGATAAVFAHQSKSPLVQIESNAGTIAKALASGSHRAETPILKQIAESIQHSASSLRSFSSITLSLLQHEKRLRAVVSLHGAINEIVSLLEPYIRLRGVAVDKALDAEVCTVLASRAALESVLTNLLINSLQAFEEAPPGDRRIVIRTANSAPKRLLLTVLDSGPGIRDLSLEDIWLPGRTTTREGTGLGLTIVKDVVKELRGRIFAHAQGELGGAEFMIDLPVRGG